MFLTKKSLKQIVILAICYLLLGSICFAMWFVFDSMDINGDIMLTFGFGMYFLCVFSIFWGKYAEGKGKLINLGNNLVRKELKPAEFIKQYEILKNSDELVVKKPCMSVLQLVAAAYDSLDDDEKALEIADEMIAAASKKLKSFAKLFKASLLFSAGKTEEAEVIFHEMQKQKLDVLSAGLLEAIYKSDRAMAMGDYKTVEAYNLQLLDRSFPKLDNLGKLVVQYKLGEVYEKLGEIDKAVACYQYCAEQGGETAIRADAAIKLTDKDWK